VGRKPQNSANLVAFLHIIDTSRLLDILKSDKTAIITAAAKADQAFNLLAAYSGYESEPAEEAHEEAPVPAYA